MDDSVREVDKTSKEFLKGREPLKKAMEELRKAMDAVAAKGVTDEEVKALVDNFLKLWLLEREVDIDFKAYGASTKELAARRKGQMA